MTRHSLPNRRLQVTEEIAWGQQNLQVSVGIDPTDGRVREIFVSGVKGDLQATLDDASVLASLALQHGVTLAELRKSLGRVPAGQLLPSDLDSPEAPAERLPASAIGAALDAAALLEEVSCP